MQTTIPGRGESTSSVAGEATPGSTPSATISPSMPRSSVRESMSNSPTSDLPEPSHAAVETPNPPNPSNGANGGEDAIRNLQQAVKAAAAGPFVLNAAFLTAGLKDSSVSVPASFDS